MLHELSGAFFIYLFMKFSKSSWYKFGFLIAVILGLFCWPFMGNNSGSIGGGSYDLTDLYAGIFILITIIIWTIYILLCLIYFSVKKNSKLLKENRILLLTGISLFVVFYSILQATWFV